MVLDEEAADETLDTLRRTFRVSHVAAPRLVVVERTTTGSAAAVRGVDGVVAVFEGAPAQAQLDALRPEERIFAAAWASRMAEGAKERRGEGMAWDTPGFVPPDPPPHER